MKAQTSLTPQPSLCNRFEFRPVAALSLALLPFLALGTGRLLAGPVTTTFSTVGSTPWTCPPGVTTISVAVQGGGGGGGGSSTGSGRIGGGGGGGACAYSSALTVVPGTIYTVTVGGGGAGGTSAAVGIAGLASSFSGGVIIPLTANGGAGGAVGAAGTSTATAAGGTAAGGTDNFSGGNGAPRGNDPTNQGAGGGGAGTTSAGSNATGAAGGAGGTGSPAGGAGANSPAVESVGIAGTIAGGGGSGGYKATVASKAGGAGARGQVSLTYIIPQKANNTDSLNVGTSWVDGSVPAAGEVPIWDSTVEAANTTNTLGSDLTFAGITIANPGAAVTLNAGNTLTLGAVATDIDLTAATQNLTLNCGLALGGANVWDVTGNRTLTVGGAVTGGFGITKQGAGTLQFSKLIGMPAAGILAVNAGTLAVNVGGIDEWTAGTSGNGTIGGLLAGLGGQSGGTVTYAGALTLGLDTTNASPTTQTYAGIIPNVGTSLALTKLGTNTLALSGNNSYTGGTTIHQGTLQVDAGGTLGDATNSLTLGTGSAGVLGTVGNLTLNTSAQVSTIAIKSNTSDTTSPANIGLLSIASGSTLTTNSFTAGVVGATGAGTSTALGTGAAGTGGTLTVNGNFNMSQAGGTLSSDAAITAVDLSGLSTLNVQAPAGTLTIGNALRSKGTLTLANNANTINVSTLSMGDTGGANSGQVNTLNLGAGTNALQSPVILIGGAKSSGVLQFAGAGGAVVITGANGTGSSAITICNNNNGTAFGISSMLLAGHPATVSASTVTIGQKAPGATGGNTGGVLTFDEGTFTATSIQMGVVAAGNAGTTITSSLTVGGPTADSAATGVVNIDANLLLAAATAGGASPISTLTLNGGTVNVNTAASTANGIFDTSTVVGASTTTLTLAGGTLNLNGGSIGGTTGTGKKNIGTLNFQSGALQNVSQINDGAALIKTTAGTLVLSGTNTYTGDTTVSEGTLTISSANPSNNASTVTIAATGATLNLTYSGTDTVDKLFIGGVQQPAGIYGPTGINIPQITNSSGNGTLTVVSNPPAGYSSWASLNGATADRSADHDADGVPNGVEFFIGGPSGNTTGFTPLPSVVNTGGILSMTWTKAANYTGTYGTDFVVETSATLTGSWTPAILDPNPGFTVTITGNDVKYTFPTGTINFARLKVTGP